MCVPIVLMSSSLPNLVYSRIDEGGGCCCSIVVHAITVVVVVVVVVVGCYW